MKLITCSQPGCKNSVSCADEMDDAEVEAVALKNGWTKKPDGTWVGCATPEICSLVVHDPAPKE